MGLAMTRHQGQDTPPACPTGKSEDIGLELVSQSVDIVTLSGQRAADGGVWAWRKLTQNTPLACPTAPGARRWTSTQSAHTDRVSSGAVLGKESGDPGSPNDL